MSSYLYAKPTRANKSHRCDWCGLPIAKGEEYIAEHVIGDDGPYLWRSHKHCSEIASFIHDYVDPYDGYTSENFCDGLEEVAKTFFCPFHCPHWDKEAKQCDMDRQITDYRGCMEKFYEFQKMRKLTFDTSDSNCLKWAWRVSEISD